MAAGTRIAQVRYGGKGANLDPFFGRQIEAGVTDDRPLPGGWVKYPFGIERASASSIDR